MSHIGLAVIGAGYWGPNLVRTALATPALQLEWLCDLDEERAQAVLGRYTTVQATTSYEEVLADPAVAAVAIATPAATHFDLVRAALEAGKHVLVEKPLTSSVAEAVKLAGLAERVRPGAHVRSHLLLHAGRAADPGAHPGRGDRRGPVRGLGPDQPRPGAARRRRAVGSGAARSVDPGLRASRGRDPGGGRRAHRRPDRHRAGLPRLPVGLAVERRPRPRARELAQPDQDPDDGLRRLPAHDRLGRHEPGRPAHDPRPRRGPASGKRAGTGRAQAGPHLLPDRRHPRPRAARAGGAQCPSWPSSPARSPRTASRSPTLARAYGSSSCSRPRRGARTTEGPGSR